MKSMKILRFSRHPTPLVYLRPKFFHPLDFGRLISDNELLPPPTSLFLSPNDNQSISVKRKHNPRMTIIYYQAFLQVGFRFHYQPINLVWLSFDFFSFSWSFTIISPSSWFYTLVYTVVQKYQEMLFIYNYSQFYYFFSTHFAINLFYLHNLET